jgi:hypothetical protein
MWRGYRRVIDFFAHRFCCVLVLALMPVGVAVAGENDCTEPGLGACCLNGNGDVCYCQSALICELLGGVFSPGQECADIVCETNCGGDCSPGETLDCNGNCVPLSWIGDGFCDSGVSQWDSYTIYLDCEEFGWDGGDCAPTGDIPQLDGACCLGDQLNCDRYCQVLPFADCINAGGVFLGEQTSCLDGVCECSPGYIGDCEGNCFPLHWFGDGICHDGERYPNWEDRLSLGCLELTCDAGDCIGLCSGACCLGNSCSESLNVIECSNLGGVFLGSGSVCNGVACSDYVVPVGISTEVEMPWGEAGGRIGEYVAAGGGLLVASVIDIQQSGGTSRGAHIYDADGVFLDRLVLVTPTTTSPFLDTDGERVVLATSGQIEVYAQSNGFELEEIITTPFQWFFDVAISGDRVVVSGSVGGIANVLIYVRAGGSWVQEHAIERDSQIKSLDLDGDVLVLADTNGVSVYERTSTEGWFFSKDLSSENNQIAVSISGDRILLGEPGGEVGGVILAGQARVFYRGSGEWTQEAALVPVDIQQSDEYGVAVAIDGDIAVVTATANSGQSLRGGVAVVYERVDSVWVQSSKVFASSAIQDMGFGASVGVTNRSVITEWDRVQDIWTLYRGAETYMLPTSNWVSNEGGDFGDAAHWIPQQPTSGTANISLPVSFELSASGVLPIDRLLIGTSRPVLTGSGVAFGSVGSGLLQVQGTQSYTGSLTIAEQLSVTGRVSVGGDRSPGVLKLSPGGSLLVSESLEINRSGELQVILTDGGDVPIQVQGAAILDGTLSGVLPSGAQPVIGDSWTIMEIGVMDEDSKFPVVVLPGLGVDRYLSVRYAEGIRGSATIVLTVEPLLGFFDWGDPSEDVVNGRAVDIVVADFGSAGGGPDGNDDIALAISGTPGRVLFLVSDGLGGISEQVSLTVCDNPVGLAAGDFDGDSRLDIAFVSTSLDIVQTLLNSGSNISEMVLSSATPTASGPVDAAVLQLGGDDEDDLIVACAGDGTVQVDGSLFGELQIFEHATGFVGDFTELASVTVNGKPGQVKPGSVGSGKGGRRAASTLLGLNELVVIEEFDGVWSEQQRIPVGSNPYDLVMDDLDGDGLDDVIVGNSGSNTVSVLLGQSDGTLGDPHVFEAGESPQSLTLLDYDGDGDRDIAFRSYNDAEESTVTLLSNDTEAGGSMAWGQDWIIQDGSAISLVASGNLNGDTTADLVTVLAPMGLRGEQSPVLIRSSNAVVSCEGDLNDDQVVDVNDILLVIGGWGTPDGDVNGDGETTVDDLLLCISTYGSCM